MRGMRRIRSFASARRLAMLAVAAVSLALGLLTPDARVGAYRMPWLVISEVYPAALSDGVGLAAAEWVEIFNPQAHAVSLDGWALEDAQAIEFLPDLTIAAGEAVIVVGSAVELELPAGRQLVVLEGPRIGSGLRNTGDRVALVDPFGVRHDAVSWGDIRQPKAFAAPDSGRSISRARLGGQRAGAPSPWSVDTDELPAGPAPRHSRPDALVQISGALVNPVDGQAESITLLNVSDQPLRTINWTMTVGSALIRLPSVRIAVGASWTLSESDGKIGAGLPDVGGHLVLRDAGGRWLATASYGSDHTFHRLPALPRGQTISFTEFARVHPATPWWAAYEDHSIGSYHLSNAPGDQTLMASEIRAGVVSQSAPRSAVRRLGQGWLGLWSAA